MIHGTDGNSNTDSKILLLITIRNELLMYKIMDGQCIGLSMYLPYVSRILCFVDFVIKIEFFCSLWIIPAFVGTIVSK